MRVIYGALHLRPGVKPWFFAVARARAPRSRVVVPRPVPRASRPRHPRRYRQWLAKRVRPLIRAHRLDGQRRRRAYRAVARGRGPSSRPHAARDADAGGPRVGSATLF